MSETTSTPIGSDLVDAAAGTNAVNAAAPDALTLEGRVATVESLVSSLQSRVTDLENRPGAGSLEVVSYDDYDYVTATTTRRRGIVVAAGTMLDEAGDSVPSLTVAWLHGEATLPASAFSPGH